MAWNQYRPRSPEGEASYTLSKYQIQLHAAELRDRQEVNLDTEPRALTRFGMKRLRNVVFVWTIIVLVIAAVATWFLDRVLAAEIVAVLTPIVIFTTPVRWLRTADPNASP
jgi:hypothetical protein